MTLSFASYSLIVTFSAEFVGSWGGCEKGSQFQKLLVIQPYVAESYLK
ncbi:hypothetical protein H6F54_19080 [Coleofasciculus sp. FACHB-501]|nr:hypothetical protein [Coleofasciculus sp. FACHB-501]